MEVYLVSDIEAGIAGTLFNGIAGAISSVNANVEFCSGLVSQSKAITEVFHCDWKKIEGIVMARLEPGQLRVLLDNHILKIGT